MTPHFLLLLSCILPAPTSTACDCVTNSSHTMCKPTVGPACQCKSHTQKIPSAAEQQTILDWHNEIRQRAAAGLETRSLGALPEGANMMKMEWDSELAEIAQRHADQCVYGHDGNNDRTVADDRFSVGQNIARYSYSSAPAQIDYPTVHQRWYTGEVEVFSKSYVNKYVFGEWGHYSQVIWWNTRSVGCGASTYKEDGWVRHYVVCNYGQAANFPGKQTYTAGTKCSNCPTNTVCDTTYDALCKYADPNIDVLQPFNTDKVYLDPIAKKK